MRLLRCGLDLKLPDQPPGPGRLDDGRFWWLGVVTRADGASVLSSQPGAPGVVGCR